MALVPTKSEEKHEPVSDMWIARKPESCLTPNTKPPLRLLDGMLEVGPVVRVAGLVLMRVPDASC
jgi:hypothetical protein